MKLRNAEHMTGIPIKTRWDTHRRDRNLLSALSKA